MCVSFCVVESSLNPEQKWARPPFMPAENHPWLESRVEGEPDRSTRLNAHQHEIWIDKNTNPWALWGIHMAPNDILCINRHTHIMHYPDELSICVFITTTCTMEPNISSEYLEEILSVCSHFLFTIFYIPTRRHNSLSAANYMSQISSACLYISARSVPRS